MCGISGFNWADKGLIEMMNGALDHRGPDDAGIYQDDSVSIGHRRLSILDLSPQGHQPMFNDERTLIIVYNGEIYNYKEIGEELKRLGHSFKSTSDTEVLLKAYEEWGEECLKRLNGMFAFCIYDLPGKKLFLARDRFGVKPLYYLMKDGKFIFASEIKAILCHPVDRVPNDKLIYDYLMFNVVDHTDETFFKEISKIPKAHFGIYDLDKKELKLRMYWNLFDHLDAPKISYDEAVTKFKDLLKDSVRVRLRSDVPVGSCLSGGIDSSSIVSLMTSMQDKCNISTFSAVYPGFERDESYYIDKQARSLGIINRKISPTADGLLEDMDDYVYHQEEPTRSTSQYAQYCVMKLANQDGFKVLLDGQGSDEQLAGYHYFFGNHIYGLVRDRDLAELITEYIDFKRNTGSKIGLESIGFMLSPDVIKKRYLNKRSFVLKPEFREAWEEKSDLVDIFFGRKDLRKSLIAHVLYRLEQLLKWEDRNSMAFSIETRIPFLDFRLVEFLLSMPSDYLIKGGITKAILRDAMKGIIDEEILDRTDKIGFESPESKWLREKQVREFVETIISSESFRNRKYFDVKSIRHNLELHMAGKKDTGLKIWQCVFLELWLRRFIDGPNQNRPV